MWAIPATFLIGVDGKVVGKDLRGNELLETLQSEIKKLKKARPETKSPGRTVKKEAIL